MMSQTMRRFLDDPCAMGAHALLVAILVCGAGGGRARALALGQEPTGSSGAGGAPSIREKQPVRKVQAPRPKPHAPRGPGETTLKGELTCAKCGLREASACQSVLVVKSGGAGAKEDGPITKYYLTSNAVTEAEHEKACGDSIAATVTGRTGEEAGHKTITPTTITFD
jgi:hypothetical protein